MKQRLKRLLPNTERIRHSRWLRWLGPAIHHPHLWHITRRGVALGFAFGVFFGLLVPVAQIPLSAATAVIFRANIPAAVGSTLITNPVTFAPIYYVAYRIGATLLGEDVQPPDFDADPAVSAAGTEEKGWIEGITAMGKPLLLGLAILASSLGLSVYLLVTGLWRLKVCFALRLRRKRRQSAAAEREAP